MVDNIKLVNVSKRYKRQVKSPGLKGSIKDLFHKNYKYIDGLKGIDLTINKGDIIGYIGENGAGKSTTIKILLGIIQKTGGKILLNGQEVSKYPNDFYYHISAVFGQRNQLWWDISIQNSFLLLKNIYKLSDKEYNMRLDEINEFLDTKSLFSSALRELSLGQKMRCEIAAAFLHNPSFVLLDEATIGIDLITKEKIRGIIKHFNEKYQTTFLMASHELGEIEKTTKSIIVLDSGKIIHQGSMEQFFADFSSKKRKLIFSTEQEVLKDRLDITKNMSIDIKKKNKYKFQCEVEKEHINYIIQHVQKTYGISDLVIREDRLEEIINKIYRKEKINDVF